MDEENNPTWELLKNLWDAVDRHVTKWDKVIDELEREVKKPGTIGPDPLF